MKILMKERRRFNYIVLVGIILLMVMQLLTYAQLKAIIELMSR